MFKFLTPKPDAECSTVSMTEVVTAKRLYQQTSLLAVTLVGTLLLSGCQQPSDTVADDNDPKTTEQIRAEDEAVAIASDSAAARIEQFQPLYVAQAQSLQQRLQAEYESLQAADASDSNSGLLIDTATDSANATESTIKDDANTLDKSPVDNKVDSNQANANQAESSNTDEANINTVNNNTVAEADESEINTSTEVGERDLEVLKRISLEPRETIILTEAQIIERYQQAMQALYQPVTTPLSAQEVDTLLDIATLLPQVFEHAEIAGRVSAKSPALARLIIQHQVWEQIEAQQVLDMQQMKLDQQQEFETLMTKFNDTIKDYDEQIAKYEKTLKAFQ